MKNIANEITMEIIEDAGLNEIKDGEPCGAWAVAHVDSLEFVSYDANPYALCMGKLTFKLGGKTFEIIEPFWHSGGGCHWATCAEEDDEIIEGPWDFDWEDSPAYIRAIKEEFEEMFNSNVPWGCCGGCI